MQLWEDWSNFQTPAEMFYLFVFLRQGLLCSPGLSSAHYISQVRLELKQSSCLNFLGTEIIVMSHHGWHEVFSKHFLFFPVIIFFVSVSSLYFFQIELMFCLSLFPLSILEIVNVRLNRANNMFTFIVDTTVH